MNRNDINNLDYENVDQVALLCSYLCTLSYKSDKEQEKWLSSRFNMNYFKSSEYETLQYYVAFDDHSKKAYFVIRGTDIKRFKDEWMDLIISLRMWPKKVNGTKAHNGYVRAGNHMYSIMKHDLKEAKLKGYDIILTGHSLGGVLAKYVGCMSHMDTTVISFGAPCLAKSDFYNNCNQTKVYKYRMDGDLIPMFPSLFYEDIFGEELLLKRGNVVIDTEDRKGFIAPLLFLAKIKMFYKLFTAVKTHNMKYYTLNLLRKYKKDKK